MKSTKTGTELRHDAKQRMIAYRKQMTEKGFVSTTIFLSKEHIKELKRLDKENGLTRVEAAEHIFYVYSQSDNKNATQTDNTNKTQNTESTTVIDSLTERIERQENDTLELRVKLNLLLERGIVPDTAAKAIDDISDLKKTSEPAIDDVLLPDTDTAIEPKAIDAIADTVTAPDAIDAVTDDVQDDAPVPATLQIDIESKKNHQAIIDNFVLDRHKKGGRGGGMTQKEIGKALEQAGIKTITGLDTWKTGNINTVFKNAIKRQES